MSTLGSLIIVLFYNICVSLFYDELFILKLILITLISALIYLNIAVWFHEQLHALVYLRMKNKK